ncbi:hypothetical protein GCM10020229_25210 [Kitasatospora albolonga]|uniref:hypothetical protein n=1 Tax=Kitasatospora albolonga TaxID=68173 RepID=UPI0033714809
MYSYEVAAAHRQPTTRPIPGMRPSYDAEHPSSPTPIYDALYSEYRRLFRALPGDRSGEESMRFEGFATRSPYEGPQRPEAYPPQQQTFHTYPGHAQGTPQFMPAQQSHPSTGQGWVATGYLSPAVGGRHRSSPMLSLPPGQY